MRAILTNFGTTGDVLPLVALGDELRRAGHETVMAFAPSHRALITAHGFDFVPVGPDARAVQDDINQRWIADASVYTSTAAMSELLAPLEATLRQTYDDLLRASRGADVLISGPAQPASRMVHETTAIPFASVQFSNFGGSGAPAMQAATAAFVNPLRVALGLRPLTNPVTLDANSPQLALYAMSRHIMPRAATWPAHIRVVGFLMLASADWTPDAALARFLADGPPPVIVTFGSMPQAEPERLLALIEQTAQLTEVRIVVQWHQPSDVSIRSSAIHVAGFVPHSWLFLRGRCIVHHGGGGTAGAAFWSGKPTVYVPHGRIFDQGYWAELSRNAGCSGAPIPIGELTAPRLAQSIREALESPQRAAAAARLGELVQAERGIVTARQAIEDLVRRIGLDLTAEAPRGFASINS